MMLSFSWLWFFPPVFNFFQTISSRTLPSASVTISTIVTFISHGFFRSLERSTLFLLSSGKVIASYYLIIFFASVLPTPSCRLKSLFHSSVAILYPVALDVVFPLFFFCREKWPCEIVRGIRSVSVSFMAFSDWRDFTGLMKCYETHRNCFWEKNRINKKRKKIERISHIFTYTHTHIHTNLNI